MTEREPHFAFTRQRLFDPIHCQIVRKWAPSAISREIIRHGSQQSDRASCADQAAWSRSDYPKSGKLVKNPTLARRVARKRQLPWSLEQIAGWLKRRYSWNNDDQVAAERIYRSLFMKARGALMKE